MRSRQPFPAKLVTSMSSDSSAMVACATLPLIVPPAQTIRNVVEEGVHADAVGIDHFNVGEHHRDDFAISAPDIVLAGIATR